MKFTGRANSLLVELLLVLLCFMFASITLVELFGASKGKSIDAHATNSAMLESQNLAEELYDTADPDAVLRSWGFAEKGEEWVLEREEYELLVSRQLEETEAGTLRTMTILAERQGKKLSEVPSTRYLPKEGTP